MPTSCTRARSASVPTPSTPTPTIIRPITGSTAISEVLIERIERLVQREVRRLPVGAAGEAEEAAGVLLDLVEHHDRVVEREPQDRQQPDHRGRGDLEADDRVDARGDRDVVDQRDQRRDRHRAFEVERQEQRHEHEEHGERDHRLLGDLATPAAAHRAVADHGERGLAVGAAGAERRRTAPASPPPSAPGRATPTGSAPTPRARCPRSARRPAATPVAFWKTPSTAGTVAGAVAVLAGNWICVPPVKSIPRLNPRNTIDAHADQHEQAERDVPRLALADDVESAGARVEPAQGGSSGSSHLRHRPSPREMRLSSVGAAHRSVRRHPARRGWGCRRRGNWRRARPAGGSRGTRRRGRGRSTGRG